MDARTVLSALREGQVPGAEALVWFAEGLASGEVTDAQAGAFAMAVCTQELGEAGRVALTLAMRDSGKQLDWDLPGPVVDKHSTGGLGDCVSLLLAPILAECGAYVPMISGRGLGHTGGTLDKLEAIPGFKVNQSQEALRRIVGEVGCAIVAADDTLAPADRRLYAVRDVTGTVESIDLITASILSKKLAAGLGTLVLDVKVGAGAFMESLSDARDLAAALVATANGAGCATSALLTNMDQPVSVNVGNSLEVADVMATLSDPKPTRLVEVTLALCGEVLARAGAAPSSEAGAEMARDVLTSGAALERMGRMVSAQGGPSDFVLNWQYHLPEAPIMREVTAVRSGYVSAVHGRALGMAVVMMGGGRIKGGEEIDHRVGFTALPALGSPIKAGAPLAMVHAATDTMADKAAAALTRSVAISDSAGASPDLIHERVTG